MHVTLTTTQGDMFNLEVSDDMDLETFRTLCSIETGITSNDCVIRFEGRHLEGGEKPLSHFKIKDHDVLLVEKKSNGPAGMDFSSINIPNTSGSTGPSSSSSSSAAPASSGLANLDFDPVRLRNEYLSNPSKMGVLRHNNAQLAKAMETSLEEFVRFLKEEQKKKQEMYEQEQQRIRKIMANPFDEEAQRLIAEEIKQKNIESNMEAAMEYHPESFGQVTMLYINCKVNGHPVKAFIDSGAQATIMGRRCAEKCGITRLIDNRWAGIAKGVGEQRISGRIHLCQLQIENDFLPSSFTILEEQEMDMLLGLDMLRRHQCCIDLKKNVLLIGTTGTETKFLDESDIPRYVREYADKGSEKESVVGSHDSQIAEAINRSIIEAQAITPANFCEDTVDELVGMGFKRDNIIKELINYGNDKQKALAALLAQSLKMP